MRRLNSLAIIVLSSTTIVSLYSCSPGVYDPYYVEPYIQQQSRYYVPSVTNAPLLSKKHDASLNLLWSSGENHSSTEVGAAYMATKHAGIIVNYSSGSGKNGYGPDYHHVELGAGYSTMIDSSWQFETYGGL